MTKELETHMDTNGINKFSIRPKSEPAIISISTDIPTIIKPPKSKVIKCKRGNVISYSI